MNMASTRKQVVSSKITEDSQRYYRAIAINSELASECLRKMAEKFLVIANVNLHEHLNQSCVKEMFKKCNLYKDQRALIESTCPDLNNMDITLLCVLLLKTSLPLRSNHRKFVEGIKETRNSLLHTPNGTFTTDIIFNKTSQLILSIAKTIDPNFDRSMAERINEIRGRELVRAISTIARLEMGESVYMLKLLETGTDSTDETDNELLIRLNLSRFARQIARSVSPADLLKLLKENDPALAERLQLNQQCGSQEFQILDIIVNITTEPKYELMKFCKFLRQVSPLIADLVENTDTDGQSTLEYLKKEELSKIQDTLHKSLQKDGNASITSEELHVLVEQELKFSIQFDLIQQCISKDYTGVEFDEHALSYRGLCIQRREAYESEPPHNILGHVRLHEQTIEEFAEYVASILKAHKIVDTPFKTAIIDHSLSALSFIELTTEDMEEIFIQYLIDCGKSKFGKGMEIALKKIQRNIKSALPASETTHSSNLQDLRQFDTPVGNTRYNAGIVRPQHGNLLVPTHEFISNVHDRTTLLPNYVIAKRVVRFAAACMNERQNGTIHFGIEQMVNNDGKITGVSEQNIHRDQLDGDIFEAFRCSYGDVLSIAIRCIGPVQYVPVEEGNVVIEIDVVPFSRYVTQILISIRYPPKGSQLQKYFVMNHNGIFDISVNEVKNADVQHEYKELSKQREHLEEPRPKDKADTQHLQTVFGKLLTRGNDYVTNHLTPVIISGIVSQCDDKKIIRSELFCERALSSSSFVLDFDSSSALRESVEKDKSIFVIQVAEDLKESYILDEQEKKQLPVWLYCNGSDDNGLTSMLFEDWMKARKYGVFNSLDYLRQQIQKGRGILIFLIFDAPTHNLKPVLELARQALLHVFTEECLIVSQNEKNVSHLKSEVKSAFGEQVVERSFITGLPWREVSRVMNSVFKQKADVICRLPCSQGHFQEMTFKEKHLLPDLCIIGGEECQHHEEYLMKEVTERQCTRKNTQEQFYKGNAASWWNFYYNHVGKRYLFDTYKELILDKLCNGHDFVEEQVIQHHPGAGGSTIGKHLIWEMSQFKGNPDSSYRCCVVKSITNETAKQIEELQSFKDIRSEKPVIILIDNKDEDIDELVENLNRLASKTGRSGVVYYLVLHIQRIEIWQTDSIPHVLKHELRPSEKNWFEEKYNEMQKSTINVETLIAFNCMRNSFNEDYVRNTTRRLMEGVNKNEIEVLKCLALIRSYENNKPVPHEVFDDMMNTIHPIRQFILSNHVRKLRNSNSNPKTTWNMKISEAMSLLVMSVELEDINKWGVSVISRMLAKAILEYLYMEKNMSLESVVNSALEKVDQMDDKNQVSKLFKETICSLFKTRLSIQHDKRRDFSELVLELVEEIQGQEGNAAANDRVLQVMRKCFDVTNDPMVGQQVARFNLHLNQFDDAEQVIQRALQLKPKNAYLSHTYGYIFKCKMKYLVAKRSKTEDGIPDEAAAEVVTAAFEGIEVLKESQRDTIDAKETTFSCFELEVTLILKLLESFELFSSFKDRTRRQTLSKFLNNTAFDVKSSKLQNLLVLCPKLEGLRVGKPMQRHMETSLRFLEDMKYQLRPKIFSKLVKANIPNLRTRFFHFYGNLTDCSYNRGTGFKHLQDAMLDCPQELEKRIDLAKRNLERQPSRPRMSDMLVYLGTKILQFDVFPNCDDDEFKKLVSFSSRLRSADAEQIGERPFMESYLYYALLNWPLSSRLRFDELAKPDEYDANIEKWKESFGSKYFFNTGKLKVLIVIVDGTPGNDFLLVETIERRCNGERQNVVTYEKNLRLDGFVDATGNVVKVLVKYPKYGEHILRIKSQNRAYELCNRRVTFVLGFTWKGPLALDVREKAKQAVEEPKLCPSRRMKSKTATNNEMRKDNSGSKVKQIVEAADKVDTEDETKLEDKSKRKQKKGKTIDIDSKDDEDSGNKTDSDSSFVLDDPELAEALEELRALAREERMSATSNNSVGIPAGVDTKKTECADTIVLEKTMSTNEVDNEKTICEANILTSYAETKPSDSVYMESSGTVDAYTQDKVDGGIADDKVKISPVGADAKSSDGVCMESSRTVYSKIPDNADTGIAEDEVKGLPAGADAKSSDCRYKESHRAAYSKTQDNVHTGIASDAVNIIPAGSDTKSSNGGCMEYPNDVGTNSLGGANICTPNREDTETDTTYTKPYTAVSKNSPDVADKEQGGCTHTMSLDNLNIEPHTSVGMESPDDIDPETTSSIHANSPDVVGKRSPHADKTELVGGAYSKLDTARHDDEKTKRSRTVRPTGADQNGNKRRNRKNPRKHQNTSGYAGKPSTLTDNIEGRDA